MQRRHGARHEGPKMPSKGSLSAWEALLAAGTSGSLGWPPRGRHTLWTIKPLEREREAFPHNHRPPSTFASPQPISPLRPCLRPFSIMFSTWIPQFDASGLTTFDNNNFWSGDSDFSGFGYPDPSNFAGPSQEYAGVDVLGDVSSYPDFLSPSTAPISLDPSNTPYPQECKLYRQ